MISRNWKKVSLLEVCDLVGGGTPSRDQADFWSGITPWVSAKAFVNDEIIDIGERISDEAVKHSATNVLPAGTVVLITRVSVGKVGILKNDTAINQDATGFIIRDKGELNAKYLFWFLKLQSKKIAFAAHGATVKGVTRKYIANYQIPLPPFSVQQKIVATLDAANDLKKIREESDKKMAEFAPALFFKMFGDPARNEKRWPVKKIGEVATTTSGGTPNRKHPEYYGGSIPWVKSGELHQSVVNSTEETLTEEGVKKSSAKLQPIGTILIAMYGATVGAISELGIEATTNQAICCVSPNKDSLVKDYFIQALKLRTSELLALRAGGAQPNLSQEKIRALDIPIPPLALQTRFEDIIIGAWTLQEKQSKSREKLDVVFDAVMADLFGSD